MTLRQDRLEQEKAKYSGIERRLEADGAVGCQLQWQECRPTPVPVSTTESVSSGRSERGGTYSLGSMQSGTADE